MAQVGALFALLSNREESCEKLRQARSLWPAGKERGFPSAPKAKSGKYANEVRRREEENRRETHCRVQREMH